MEVLAWIVFAIVLFSGLLYHRVSIKWFALVTQGFLIFLMLCSHVAAVVQVLLWLVDAVIFIPFTFPVLRRRFITRSILTTFRHVMPTMSQTEQEALEAGTVGWSGDLFSGSPDWQKLHAFPAIQLSTEEQAFLAGPVESLCEMLDDWNISRSMVIPEAVWEFLKKHGFFSMIIPKQYGGKAFSALAHSEVIAKVSGVSVAVATVISVPNSLGPGELLLHYGTDEQRAYYLPRLASGAEIPCFALTSPRAGSDASAIEDHGVVCQATFEGRSQLCIRLNWSKRYITLAPVATLLGLAFKLYDPEKLLGDREDIGITCALIPVTTPNVIIGRRHYPLDCAFPNGPTQGKDVLIPIDWVIGGVKMVGHGWRMLMECLAAGRSISLPSMVAGGAKVSALCSGAYARIRRQFNMPIGEFEGVQMALARVAAHTYMLDALRRFTLASVDRGEKPVVESAMSKYHTTELSRMIALDAMDIHGGKGICMGPNNYMAQTYIELPVSITVEGANILTRSMIIFGQGAIRCHPYVLAELKAANQKNLEQGLIEFDKALFSHAGFVLSNQVRALVLALTSGRFTRAPEGPLKRYYQQFFRFSSALSLLADFSLLTLGGSLKRLENLSARLADLLSYTYIGSAVLRQYHLAASDTQQALLPLIQWICQDLLYQLQNTMHHFLLNFPNVFVARALRAHVFPLGRHFNPPSDALTAQLAKLLIQPSQLRDVLFEGMYQKEAPNNAVVRLNTVLAQAISVEPLIHRVNVAKRNKVIKGKSFVELVQDALTASVLTAQEAAQLLAADAAKMSIINVDDFSPEAPYFKAEGV